MRNVKSVANLNKESRFAMQIHINLLRPLLTHHMKNSSPPEYYKILKNIRDVMFR